MSVVKHLPMWFPGAEFKRNAIVWKAKMEEFVNKPYEEVKQRMVCPPRMLMDTTSSHLRGI